jgi:hypothetical protein
VKATAITIALWDYFDEKAGKPFDCRPIGRKLSVEEADVVKVFNRLTETGFFTGGSRSYLRGHGKFMPSFGLTILTSITLEEGRVIINGQKCDMRKPVNNQSLALCKGDACDLRKTSKDQALSRCKGANCNYRKVAEAEPSSPAAISENENGDKYAGKVVVVVTHGPEEAAKLVTCIIDGKKGA